MSSGGNQNLQLDLRYSITILTCTGRKLTYCFVSGTFPLPAVSENSTKPSFNELETSSSSLHHHALFS